MKLRTGNYLAAICLFLYLPAFVTAQQVIEQPLVIRSAIPQSTLDFSELLTLQDNNLSGETRFLTIGRMNNKPFFRHLNSDRILFYNQNGTELNMEIVDDGFLYPRAGVIANYMIEKAGYWDASTSAEVSVSGGNLFGGGPQTKTFGGGWNPTATGQHITLDVGTPVPVNYLTFGTFWATDPRYIPSGYTISYSNDNINYVTLETITNNINLNPVHNLGNTWGRYWRITVTGFQPTQTYASIYGLKLLSTIGGASIGNFWGAGYSTSNISFNGGGVSIGTNRLPEGYRMAVNGAIITTKVKVSSYANWPDYVFGDNYRLRPLPELAGYIQQNRHLPGVASANEVARDGIDLAANQAALLEKIEELTLYLIEQNKQIQEMKKEIQVLKGLR